MCFYFDNVLWNVKTRILVFMKTLLFIIMIIKLHSRDEICKHMQKKHGKGIYNSFRSFETLKTKSENVILDIKLNQICKTEGLIPTFANTAQKNGVFY